MSPTFRTLERTVTLDGVTRTIARWSEQPEQKALGLTRRAIATRVFNKWSPEDTLRTPRGEERLSLGAKTTKSERAEAVAAEPEGSPLIRRLSAELERIERRMRAWCDVLEHAAQSEQLRANEGAE